MGINMRKKIVIYGAGGFGREVLQIIRDINKHDNNETWTPLGYLVDSEYISTNIISGLPILGTLNWLKENSEVFVIVAIGSSSLRKKICQKINTSIGDRFATLIHPRAWIGDQVKIGTGSIICAGSLITTDISIGKHTHINIGATIGHDASLMDYVTLNPNVSISGNTSINNGCEIGTGSIIIPKITIGKWSIIGAGSVVTKSLPENITAVGAPAKVIKTRPSGWHL